MGEYNKLYFVYFVVFLHKMIPDINKFCQEKFPLVKSIIVFDGSQGLLIDLACFCNPNEAIIGEQEKKCDHMWEGLSQGDIEDEDVNKIRLDKRRQLLKLSTQEYYIIASTLVHY